MVKWAGLVGSDVTTTTTLESQGNSAGTATPVEV